jgi:DNA-binding CsgD family transcriptional regulator
MARLQDDLFAFLEYARGASHAADLDNAFANLIGDWGFTHWTTMPIATGAMSAVRPFEVVFGRPSATWSEEYKEKNYFPRDAAIRALLQSNEPIWWSAFAKAPRLTKDERRLFAEARNHGVMEGLSTPLRLANHAVWVTALTGRDAKPHWMVSDAARVASERYLLRALELRAAPARGAAATLTEGQMEIIRLLAEGLNLKEAAHALGRSPRTIYNQMHLAKHRLRAKNIPELIRRAARAGLL